MCRGLPTRCHAYGPVSIASMTHVGTVACQQLQQLRVSVEGGQVQSRAAITVPRICTATHGAQSVSHATPALGMDLPFRLELLHLSRLRHPHAPWKLAGLTAVCLLGEEHAGDPHVPPTDGPVQRTVALPLPIHACPVLQQRTHHLLFHTRM